MKLGMHTSQWCDVFSNDTLDVLDTAKGYGFDYVEIPLTHLDVYDPKATKERLDSLGLEATTATVLFDPAMDITSFDPAVRANGIKYLKECVDAAAATGSPVVTGVTYQQYKKPAVHKPSDDEWNFAADALREVAQYGQDKGVGISCEVIVRYESSLLNTAEEARRLMDMIGEPNAYIHLDSYHMNVEEKDFYDAIVTAGDRLGFFHMCENDRGIPGTGHVDWDGIFRGFKDIGFDGYLGFEGYTPDTWANAGGWVWRPYAPDADTYVRQSIEFAHKMADKYDLKLGK